MAEPEQTDSRDREFFAIPGFAKSFAAAARRRGGGGEDPTVRPDRSDRSRLTSRAVVICAVAALAVAGTIGIGALVAYQRGQHGTTQNAANLSALAATGSGKASPSLSPSPVRTITLPPPSPSPRATTDTAASTPSTEATTAETAQTVHETPTTAPTTSTAHNAAVVVTTPPSQSGGTATKISGSIQCQSKSVEGVWIQAANNGSGWAPWVSSAANPQFATYSYTLPYGGEYSVHVGCGGTTSSWAVAEYSSFYGGTVNSFYCYDESSSTLYTYCAKSP